MMKIIFFNKVSCCRQLKISLWIDEIIDWYILIWFGYSFYPAFV